MNKSTQLFTHLRMWNIVALRESGSVRHDTQIRKSGKAHFDLLAEQHDEGLPRWSRHLIVSTRASRPSALLHIRPSIDSFEVA